MTISEDGEIPATMTVKCPNCGQVLSIPMKYADGPTIDYEGVCAGQLPNQVLCNASILTTVTIPEERDR